MTTINFGRKLGSKDKAPRKKRNLLATGAKVLGGAAALGAVGGTIYTGKKIGDISKALSKSNAAGYEAFKNSPGFVKHAFGKYTDVIEDLGSTIAKTPDSPAAGLGTSVRDAMRRQKLKLRKGFLESTQLDQKINAQRAAIAHTKSGDLANQSDAFKKQVIDKQRKARQATRSSGDLTRRMEDEVGKYFQTTSGGRGKKKIVDPRILTNRFVSTPRLKGRKKFLGLFSNNNNNMFFLSDSSANFARKKGSKDKGKRKSRNVWEQAQYMQDMKVRSMTPEERNKQIRNATLLGAGISGTYTGLGHVAGHASPNIGKMMYGNLNGVKKLTVPIAIGGTLLSAGIGAGLSRWSAKRQQKKSLERKW